MKHSLKRFVSWMLVLCMVLSFVPAVDAAATVTWKETECKITAEISDRRVQKDGAAEREDSEMVRVSIVLEQPSTVQAGYATMGIAANSKAMAYRAELLSTQKRMEKTISLCALNGRPLNVVWNMTLVGNIISAWVPYGAMEEIAAIPGVKTVAMEAQYEPAVAERHEGVAPNAYPSGSMIGSGVLWNGGYTGAGSRIAIVDTGTDTDHQSLDNGAYLYALSENAKKKGMTLADYKASLNLMTKETIAAVLPQLHAAERYPGITAEDLYINEKLAFGFNYVDYNLNIVHDFDYQGEHGSHVAGISTANRFIPDGRGGYMDARDSVLMLGVAPDAQLITMKVFGNGSPFDSDYMCAIEDAIILGCDAVNLSLGTTMPGSPYTDVYSELMEMMTETDTVVSISAGNASNWSVASIFGYLYNEDVSFDTVGAPGSFANAFTVASVENDGGVGNYFAVNGRNMFYGEMFNGFGNTPFVGLDKSLNLDGTEYEYVFLDGLGYAEEYNGIDVSNRIVFVSRGVLNFAEKANNALSRGAVAVIVYNNEAGLHGMDLTGLYYAAPVIAITAEDAYAIRQMSQDRGTYLTGKLTVYGKMGVSLSGSAYYKMSSFSSWGVPGSLTLKPEITAPGGQINSLWGSNAVTGGGSDKYETMSGTSMAAPQVAGMAALLAQVYREKGMEAKSGISARHLAQSLLMSTAQPLYEEDSGGNYYSLMNQGAGLARVDLAARADSFIRVEGQEDYKVKAELGDDPDRTGVYEFSFELTNLTDSEKVYTLDADLFRQDVFEYQPDSDVWLLDTWTVGLDAEVSFSSAAISGSGGERDLNGDGVTNAADADYLLEYTIGNVSALKADGDVDGDGTVDTYDAHLLLASVSGDTVTVPAKQTVTVSVRMELTEEAKAELDAKNPKGTYVEAFVYARGVADAEGTVGTVHSIPVLAFYGDWSEPAMFDRGTLIEHIYLAVNTAPYLYRFIGPYGNALGIDYSDGMEYYFGGNPVLDDEAYLPQRNAFSSTNGSKITEQTFSLIRGAGNARIQVRNADNGEVYMEKILGELYPAYYNPSVGTWENTIQYAKLNWAGTDAAGKALAEGTHVEIALTAVPHYYRQEDGSYPFEGLGEGSTMSFGFTIDNTAPEMLTMDTSRLEQDRLTVTALDNEYVAAVALLNAGGTKMYSVSTPNQTQKNVKVSAELDLTDVFGSKFLIAVYDYANNVSVYQVEMDLGEAVREYFTAVDGQSNTYVSVDTMGAVNKIAETGLPIGIRAAEYVGGYVFSITDDNSFCVANDEDLSYTQRICEIDADKQWLITGVNDLAYNKVDDKLYCQFYSQLNSEMTPYLGTIDMLSGELDVICELPEDVNTMAIDGQGNFYSAGFNSNILYTYTLEQIRASEPSMTVVGEMGYYYSSMLSSMAWDHNEDKLYWAFPNTLLRINHKTAEPTLLGYHQEVLVGLYTRPEADEGRFDPVDTVTGLELNHTATRVLKGAAYTLEATVWPWNASDRTVRWTSSDESIATVDDKGRVTGLKEGKCTITAISNLDPSIRASCTIEVFLLDKTLNALIWDEDGEIHMSEFSTAKLPEYTKLADTHLGHNLASATIGQDGNIYAASLENGSLKSELYKLDPVTFQPTLIGPSTDGYVDIAPAPGQPGNSLMAVWGGNVLNVDATTGDYYNWYYMFTYNLVGLAYVGTDYNYTAWGYDTQVDWYFIFDRMGYVYLMGFLEQDGKYYYLEHDQLAPGGIYTHINYQEETDYFCSAYFDGSMLYFSAYRQEKNNVTLMAIDVAGGSKACYEVGTFADGVWPVAGLMELDKTEPENHFGLLVTNAKPVEVLPEPELMGLNEGKAEGTLNSAVAPQSSGEVKNDLVFVDVTVPEDATNGLLSVAYDAEKLELVDVVGKSDAFAWNDNDGYVRLAFAEVSALAADSTVATLRFKALDEGSTELTVVPWQINDSDQPMYDKAEVIQVELPAINPFVDVSETTHRAFYDAILWAAKSGITTGTDATHFNPSGTCMRGHVVTFLWRAMGEPEPTTTVNPFVDVKETDFFYKPVLWAYENGITTGADASHFNPYGKCNRAQVVTFLWRAVGKPGASATESGFTDVTKPGEFYYNAVLWAVENNITNGMGDGTFGTMKTCNRAQVVTFLYRTFRK